MFTAGAEQDLRSPDWCVRNLDRKILHSLSGSLPAREKLSARHQTCCDYMSFSFSVWCCCCGGGGGGGGTNFTHGEPCREQNLDFVLISKIAICQGPSKTSPQARPHVRLPLLITRQQLAFHHVFEGKTHNDVLFFFDMQMMFAIKTGL